MTSLSWNRDIALEQLGGEEALLCKCLEVYSYSVKSDLQRIDEGVAKKNGKAIRDGAHSLKGASVTIGMHGFFKTAIALEEAAMLEKFPDIERYVRQLKKLVRELDRLVSEICSS